MADFQPRFVDLVRNYTSTQGTGGFVLGPAVNGFTGFASALQPGDSFYYSAIGVDKPSEREVGRGTLQANGSISRSPIGGSATNFSNGTKTVALIAAAEWFNAVQGSAGSLPLVAATRSALADAAPTTAPAVLSEAGREGVFAFDSSNMSSAVTSDPRQGIYVAPATDATGASGAWVRRYSGQVNVRWFGAVGNDLTDDGPAFVAAINYLQSIARLGFGYSSASPTLFVPFGVYFLATTTLDLIHTMILEGENAGEAGGGATVLRWAANTTGIRVQRFNTSGATTLDAATHSGGDASVIQRLYLKGAYSGIEGEFHGIHLRARATIRDCYIENFQGDGIHIKASAAGTPEGNANNFEITRAFVASCRNGLYVEGGDVNAGTIRALDSNYNRMWGVNDNSFLGNSYIGCHTAGNALGAYRTTNLNAANVIIGCYSEGDQPASSLSQRTLTLGGLHAAGLTGGAYIRADLGETKFDKVRVLSDFAAEGQCIFFNDVSAVNGKSVGGFSGYFTGILSKVYSTAGMGYVQAWSAANGDEPLTLKAQSVAFEIVGAQVGKFQSDGLHVTGVGAFSGALAASNFSGSASGTNTGDQTITLTGDVTGSGTGIFAATISAGAVSLSKMANLAANSIIGNNTSSAATPVALTASQVKTLLGLAAIATSSSGADLTASTVTFAKIQNVSATARLLGRASAGAGIIEELGLAGGLTISGTNLSLGAITPTAVLSIGAVTTSSPTAGNGYATGAGGTVTQATSKSTGVTLNKVCGQITLNAAALAASTSVGFTLTNSAIAATDVVIVNIASGATGDSYQATIDAVAAGSCRISLRNISAASKSEAVVLNFAVCKSVNA
jgi:hypothetical protein